MSLEMIKRNTVLPAVYVEIVMSKPILPRKGGAAMLSRNSHEGLDTTRMITSRIILVCLRKLTDN